MHDPPSSIGKTPSETHKSFATKTRAVVNQGHILDNPSMGCLAALWYSHRVTPDRLPTYDRFDPLDVPARYWKNLMLVKLIGDRRRFFYELIGGEIEDHNGFPGQKRYLADLPLRNKHVMAREFAICIREAQPVYSEGPYMGQANFVKGVSRLLAPYALDDEAREIAIVGMVAFAHEA